LGAIAVKRAFYQFRLLVAETLLGWAFTIMPNSPNKESLARFIEGYIETEIGL